MEEFQRYVKDVRGLANQALLCGGAPDVVDGITDVLNGQPAATLRRCVDLEDRRALGAYFTRRSLASGLLEQRSWPGESVFLDPACGAGDLLLAAAGQLPVLDTALATAERWGRSLWGWDIVEEFVELARLRLVLAVIASGAPLCEARLPELERCFDHLTVKCSLSHSHPICGIDCILMNPPFCMVESEPDCLWSTGKVNAAARFVSHYAEHALNGTRLLAILPEVLRSGTRYAAWRETVSGHLRDCTIRQLDAFDTWTDVHVFSLSALCSRNGTRIPVDWKMGIGSSSGTVGDLCEVRVGTVVPHRHKEEGPLVPYVTVPDLKSGAVVTRIRKSRRFAGTLADAPFVAVRRTSRPGERPRANGTVVASDGKVAVENHLIVIRPTDAKIETCRELLAHLNAPDTSKWLDARIGCHHLTADAIRQLPWPCEDQP